MVCQKYTTEITERKREQHLQYKERGIFQQFKHQDSQTEPLQEQLDTLPPPLRMSYCVAHRRAIILQGQEVNVLLQARRCHLQKTTESVPDVPCAWIGDPILRTEYHDRFANRTYD